MSELKVNSVLDANGGNTATINGFTPSVSNMAGRNRIINGAMTIDQRNAGAAVTVNSAARIYTVDRWFGFGQGSDGVFTVQRSAVAPAGFANSALITVTTADASIGSSQLYVFGQSIEGFNSADLGWGSAAAQTVTLSFWVRSSLTGTFGGVINNNAGNRTYPFTYTISSANTFERKTITITGDTTGTWETGSSSGLTVFFSLGAGSSFLGSAGSWSGSTFFGASGQTQVVATNGATFYITGVQLEAGDTATPFEHRSYGQELALCQRYYWKNNTSVLTSAWGSLYNTTNGRVWRSLPVPMRATPSLTVDTNTFHLVGFGDVTGSLSGVVVDTTTVSFDGVSISTSGFAGQPFSYARSFQVSAEL